MAGTYVDVPTRRLGFDRDGSTGFIGNGPGNAVVGTLTATQMQYLNDESGVNDVILFGSTGAQSGGIIFPVPVNIAGWCIRGSANAGDAIFETSADTTNGGDGTWTVRGTATGAFATTPIIDSSTVSVVPAYRTNITLGAFNNVKGVRLRRPGGGCQLYTFHVYGTLTTAPTTGLAIWHPTVDAEATGAYFDWGDVPRGSTDTRTFRVKNFSTLTANGIVTSFEALTPGSPSIVTAHTFSLDNITYTASIAVGNLAPGALSPVLYVKRVIPSGGALGPWAGRIIAVASSFS